MFKEKRKNKRQQYTPTPMPSSEKARKEQMWYNTDYMKWHQEQINGQVFENTRAIGKLKSALSRSKAWLAGLSAGIGFGIWALTELADVINKLKDIAQ